MRIPPAAIAALVLLCPVPAAGPATAAAATAGGPAAGGEAGRYDIERYLQIRSASSAGLSPDGRTVAFLTNVTGSNQIWTVPASGGWPDPITFFADRVAAVEWSPRGDWLAFSRDAGGDENYQLWLVSPDGSRLVELTKAPGVRHNFGSWSKDGRFIAYASNARNPKHFDVHVLDVATRQARPVLQRDEFLSAGPFSHDGKRLIVGRANGSLDNDLFVLDVAAATGAGPAGGPAEPVHLTPHEGIAIHDPVGWAQDGRSIWLLSDSGREFQALGRLDLGAKTIAWVRQPDWDVERAALSPNGGTLAMVVNEDGYDTIRLIDAATLKDRPAPDLDRGSITNLGFSRDGRQLALSLATPTRNSNVWLVDLHTGAARQVTYASTAGIPPSSFVEPRLVRHRTFDGLEIPSFFYLPREARRGEGLPCIVNPHGGPEGQTTARFSPVIQHYVNRGYAFWAPNVRGSTGYGKTFTHLDDVRRREDAVRDLVAGVDWLKSSGHVDPRKIAVMGGSYGGYMTLAAATLYPDLWAAAVDSYGIANFRTFFGKTASYRVHLRASEYGDPVKDADFLDSISPIHKVDRIMAPLLVLQGANDPRVPQAEAEQIVAAVRKKGGVVEYVLFPDEGHGWSKLPNQITAHRAIADFLDRHVLKAAPQGPSR
jgi:dipeptidyl aminopeptidase/acylaminoacyl peptidase